MTILDDRQLMDWMAECEPPVQSPIRVRRHAVRPRSAGPAPARPAVAPLRYRGSGVPVSQARHLPRPVGTTVTVALALAAALITLWLGSLGQASGERTAAAIPDRLAAVSVPDQLAVVQVRAGETLQQLAGRVAPDSPIGQVVERIRDLNHLETVALAAGQTLIAPVG